MSEYASQLREGILEAYTGVVAGFKNTEKGLIYFIFRSSESFY